MLEFFRLPQFWAAFAMAICATALGGYTWTYGPGWRRVALTLALAGPAFIVWTGYRFGVPSSVAVAVTAGVVAALARDIGSDRVRVLAVVEERIHEAEAGTESDLRLAS